MNIAQLQAAFSPQVIASVTLSIEAAVKRSLVQYPLRGEMTGAEVKRRIRWCCDTAVMLRRQLVWSSERICDTMPSALSTYLATGDWTPPVGRIW